MELDLDKEGRCSHHRCDHFPVIKYVTVGTQAHSRAAQQALDSADVWWIGSVCTHMCSLCTHVCIYDG